ncbi:hypothetical protein [Flaviflagellibacter deserti]|uniref:Uncharacterized protein n=1 Tax=Flaviflagellibacter deserti TaxID=2267266 RepID=A0ABV9YZS8_9HYPH
MSAAVKAKYAGDKAPVVQFLKTLDGLIHEGKFREAAESFKKFEEDNRDSDFMVEEAIPFRVQNYLSHTIGATAFVKYTLRHSTWAVELTRAFHDPEKFDTFVKNAAAEVKKLA